MTLNSGMENCKSLRDPVTNKLIKRIEKLEDEVSSLNGSVNTENVNAENVYTSTLESDIASLSQLKSDNINATSVEARDVNTESLKATKATISNLDGNVAIAGDVKAKNISADKLSVTDLEVENRTFPSLNVTGDTVLNKTTAEEVETKKLKVTERLKLNDGISLGSFTADSASINNAVIGNINGVDITSSSIKTKTLESDDITADNITSGNVNSTTVNAESVAAAHTQTNDIDAGVYKRNDSFYINIDIETGAKGIIKLPKFDGTGKFYFVDEEENSVISITVINNKTALQSTLINYSQKGLYLTDINMGTDGHIYFGISDQGNIKKMYYTLDINNDFIEVPVQMPTVTSFDDIEVEYGYVPQYRTRVVILGDEKHVNDYGLDVRGLLNPKSLQFPEIAKVPGLEVDNDALIHNNLTVEGNINGKLTNSINVLVDDGTYKLYDNTEQVYIDVVYKAICDDEENEIKTTYLKINDAIATYVNKNQIGAQTTSSATGVCPLDENGLIPVNRLPTESLVFKGLWNASTNSPRLSNSTGTKGDFYICSVAGTQNLGSGNITFSENDTVIHDGTVWHRVASSSTRTELLNIIGNSSETDTGLMTPESFNKLKGIEKGAEVNVQADWAQNNTASDSYIKNKPNLKPVATSGKFNDLSNKPTLSSTVGKVTLSDTSGWKTECAVPQLNVVSLTLSQYNALSHKDPNTVYAITG
ncbi:MAG: hypothetical protein U0L18_08935 [Acutalibacteraceae bacterium]|nr:hypothetical protein [Acutalibacteraceae bacterium]